MSHRLAVGPGWELPSHQGLVPSHPGPGLAWDRELPSHRDLVPSRSHEKKFGPIPSRSHPGPVPRMLLFYNIHTNIRSIQSMNISLESAHQELHNELFSD